MSWNLFLEKCIKRMRDRGRSEKYIKKRISELEASYEKEYGDIFDIDMMDDDEEPVNLLTPETVKIITKEERISELSQHYQSVEKEKSIKFFPSEHQIKNINKPGPFGKTPIIEAASRGNIKEVMDLIEKGADLTHKDNNQHTAKQVAEMEGHKTLAKILQKMME